MRFASIGGIVEGSCFALAFRGREEQSLLRMFGQADEAGFAVGIGSDLQVELVKAAEAVSDVHADVGGVDGFAGGVVDYEIRGAGAKSGVDGGYGFGVVVGARRTRLKKYRQRQDGDRDDAMGASHTD